MEKQGWKDGEGLGSSQVGISEALENEGQHPRCKRGFGCVNHRLKDSRRLLTCSHFLSCCGLTTAWCPSCRYHGEKLLRHPLKKARGDFHISSVYDQPRDIDRGDTVLQRQPTISMKYRDWQPGGSMGPPR